MDASLAMAALSDLVSVLARTTGLPEAEVFAYGRFAREAGFISQKGRGRGAAQMSTRDAANLLIAIMGTDVTREAGKAIDRYRALTGYAEKPVGRGGQVFFDWISPPGIQRDETPLWDYLLDFDFGRFLEFLIDAAKNDEIRRLLRSVELMDRTPENYALAEQHPRANIETLLDLGAKKLDPNLAIIGVEKALSVVVNRSDLVIAVEFSRSQRGRHETLWHLTFGANLYSIGGDFRVKAEVGLTTIAALGWCLAGREIPKRVQSLQIEDFIFGQNGDPSFHSPAKNEGEHH